MNKKDYKEIARIINKHGEVVPLLEKESDKEFDTAIITVKVLIKDLMIPLKEKIKKKYQKCVKILRDMVEENNSLKMLE